MPAPPRSPAERPSADPLVEYCVNNVADDDRVALDGSDLRVERTACLGRCGDCYASPYLVVDGEYVPGDHAELLARLGGDS